MVVKVYISGISGNKEVKKRQQRVLMILDSKNIKYEVIDITEPGKEAEKDFMQTNSKSNGGTVSDPNPRSPLPPQIFNDEDYCGDYDQFDLANEVDTLEQFVKVEAPPEEPAQVADTKEKAVNGVEGESKEENSEAKTDDVAPDNTEDSVEKVEDKEGSPVNEATPAKDASSKEATPAKDEDADIKEDTKEKSSEEDTTVRAKSVDKEGSPVKSETGDKEGTPEKAQSLIEETVEVSKEHATEAEALNENGTVSSRDPSEEKDAQEIEKSDVAEVKKDNPSEALIQSEQAAATE